MDGYKVWECTQATHQTMYIPTGFLVCESVLNAEPALGFRLSLIMKGTAKDLKEIYDWIAVDPRDDILKTLGPVNKFLSKQ
eukprot:402646-Alexandrium_andersonii.AAC.1